MKYIFKTFLILMTLSWSNGFSQDTQISLQTQVAKLVITDLVKGDSAKEQIKLLAKEADLLAEQISVKDSIIVKQKSIISNYEEIVGTKEEQLNTSKELSLMLQTDLKKQKAKTKLFKFASGGMIIGAIILGAL